MSTIPRNKQREHKLYRMVAADPDSFTDIEAGLVGLNKRINQEEVSLPVVDRPRRRKRKIVRPTVAIEEPIFVNTAPIVSISLPPDGSSHGLGIPITFVAPATDAGDGAI